MLRRELIVDFWLFSGMLTTSRTFEGGTSIAVALQSDKSGILGVWETNVAKDVADVDLLLL